MTGPERALRVNAVTSSLRIRPLGPEPVTSPRSTPSSRAKRRTDGLACTRLPRTTSADGSAGGGLGSAGAAGSGGVGAGGSAGEGWRGAGQIGPAPRPASGHGNARCAIRHRGFLCSARGLLRYRRRGRPCCGPLREREDHGALGDPVPDFDLDGLDGAGVGRGHLHGGLVALERNERGLGLYVIAGFDEDLDDLDVLEVADVGEHHLADRGHARSLTDRPPACETR